MALKVVQLIKQTVLVRLSGKRGPPGPPGPAGGVDGLPDGTNVGDVLTWDGATWLGAPPGGFLVQSFGAVVAIVEAGQLVTAPSFVASYSVAPTAATLTDSEGTAAKDVTATPTAFSSSASFQKNAPGSVVTFTLQATNIEAASRNATITWGQRNYWGVGTSGQSGAAFIQGLAGNALAMSRAKSFTVTAGAGQTIYYATRAAYGTPTFKDHATGFGFAMTHVGDFTVTNAQGIDDDYQLWESDNAALGTVTVDVT